MYKWFFDIAGFSWFHAYFSYKNSNLAYKTSKGSSRETLGKTAAQNFYKMNYTGQKAIINLTSEEGIVLQEINENNFGWKVVFSFKNDNLIKQFEYNEITAVEKVKDEIVLKQLIKNINAEDLNTQIWSSEILCYFIEEYGNNIEMVELKQAIESMINKLKLKNEYDIEQKLAEGIFEFLWLKKIDKKEEEQLIKTLANLNKDCLYCYLDDDAYLAIEEVKKFIERKQVEYNTNR